MSISRTTYHARRDDDSGEVLALFRLRTTDESIEGEVYHPGKGWLEDNRAFDVTLNGQDYDLVDEDQVEELVASMDSAPD